MGKLILCSGSRTKRPYGFTSTGIRVYSIEELCYYLYHHVYMIEEDMFCDALIDWIRTELKLPERADKLRELKNKKADVKTMITVILCSADYYTEYEIKGLLKMLDEIIGMPLIKRSCIKAKNCLKNKQFTEAAEEYDRILNSKEAADLLPEEYGDILHNLAVAKIHITGLKEASNLFFQAYERNQREDSLLQYLYSLRLSSSEDRYLDKIKEYQISGELDLRIKSDLEQIGNEATHSEMMLEINHLKKRKAQGRMSEYYKEMDDIIDSWKAKIRQI